MIAYRVWYEGYNLRLAELTRSKTFGRLVGMSAINVQTVAENGAKQWRHKKVMAGGSSLFDIDPYCLNTARFMTGEKPTEIMATVYSPPEDPRYKDVEETVSFTLRFPSNTIANCLCSYGARDNKNQRSNFATAVADMPNAYLYEGQKLTITSRQSDATSEATLTLQSSKPIFRRNRSHGHLWLRIERVRRARKVCRTPSHTERPSSCPMSRLSARWW